MIRDVVQRAGTFSPAFHYSMLSDRRRLDPFRRAIAAVVQEGNSVLDLGTGSGILAWLAAKKASKVYAVEVQPEMADLAYSAFQRHPQKEKFQLIRKPAQELTPADIPELVDVVTGELLQTWLMDEQQVPAINAALRFLKPGGKVIPRKVINLATLVEASYTTAQYLLPTSYYQSDPLPPPARLSETIVAGTVELDHANGDPAIKRPPAHAEGKLKVICSGIANALRLDSVAELAEGISVGEAPTLFAPYIMPILEPKLVKAGDVAHIEATYQFGGPFSALQIQLKVS